MTDLGWIKLHKKFLDSPVWKYSVTAKMPHLITVWLHLLLSANWTEKKWYDGKEETSIPAGSLITSIGNLSEQVALTSMQVRVCLSHLEKMNMVTRKTTNKWTQLWIVNWSKYQIVNIDDNKHDNKPITNEQQTNNKPITTTKEYKNIRNKEIISKDITEASVELVKNSYGNPKINEIISRLERHLGSKLDDTVSRNRNYANLLLKKYSDEQINAIFQALPLSKFWSNKVTSIPDIYYNAAKIINSVRETKTSFADLSNL